MVPFPEYCHKYVPTPTYAVCIYSSQYVFYSKFAGLNVSYGCLVSLMVGVASCFSHLQKYY